MAICEVCKLRVTGRKSPGVQCTGCKLFFHFQEKCGNITSDEADLIEQKRLVWQCKKCKRSRQSLIFPRGDTTIPVEEDDEDIQEVTPDMNSIIKDQKELRKNVRELKKLMEEMIQKVDTYTTIVDTMNNISKRMELLEKKFEFTDKTIPQNINNNTNYNDNFNKNSFANIVKHPVIILQPKDTSKNIDDTTKEVKQSINPDEFNIRGIKQTVKGGIVISCSNDQNVVDLTNEFKSKLGVDYDIKVPDKKLNQIKLFGLSKKYELEELLTKLRNQNDVLTDESIVRIVHTKFNNNRYTLFLETDEVTHNQLINAKRLNIDWDVCRVYEFTNTMRCLKCQQFNHTSKYCKNHDKCGKCAGDHSTRTCTSLDNICVNCCSYRERLRISIDANHVAWSVQCPVYLHITEAD